MKAAFQKIDTDNSGTISVDELRIALQNLRMDNSEAEELIKNADQNGDGQIDYYEFCCMLNNQEETKFRTQMSLPKNKSMLTN